MDQAAVQMLNTAAAGAGVSVAQVQDQPAQTAGVDIGSDKVVTSPLVGTFYASSSPDADAFVKVVLSEYKSLRLRTVLRR